MTFRDFKLDEKLLEGLDIIGFNKPTPIQEQAIPVINDGHDIIACAQTGTGKTAAFLLPVINRIMHSERDRINTVIISPTRELAMQIDQQVEGFAYFAGVSSVPVYGGGGGDTFDTQKKALVEGADIIIATPGRLIAHLQMGYVKLDHVKHLILDEADRMLDMGFHDDIMQIINYMPKDRQTLLFSATMPPKIKKLTSKILKDPKEITIAISQIAKGVMQGAFNVHDPQKIPLLKELIIGKETELKSIIIFCSTKKSVKELERELKRSGMSVRSIQSDLEQKEREEVLNEFKNKKIQILVGTDIVSRGIDVDSISMVINYDVPSDAEDYVHRVGRTARAESTGIAITLINEADQYSFNLIEELIGKEVKKVPLPASIGKGPVYLGAKARKPQRGGAGKKRMAGKRK